MTREHGETAAALQLEALTSVTKRRLFGQVVDTPFGWGGGTHRIALHVDGDVWRSLLLPAPAEKDAKRAPAALGPAAVCSGGFPLPPTLSPGLLKPCHSSADSIFHIL